MSESLLQSAAKPPFRPVENRQTAIGHSSWPVWIGLSALLVTIGFPIAILFLQSIFPAIGQSSLAGAFRPYLDIAATDGLVRMWNNSLGCAVLTTLFACALGLPAGWLIARTNLPGKSLLRVSLLLPIMSPPYLLALAYVLLLQDNGLVDTFVGRLPEPIRNAFFGMGGVVFIMGLTSFGTVALLVEASLQGVSTRLEDAARCLGAPRADIFWRITLPLLMPALINGGVLVFVDTLSNFGIAAILGPRSNLVLLPSVIYEMLTTWPADVPRAAAISSILAIAAVVMVTAARLYIGVRAIANGRTPAGRMAQLNVLETVVSLAFFAVLFFFSSLLPNATVCLMSLVERWQDGDPAFTFKHYTAIFQWGSGGMQALTTSAGLSAAAATVCAVLGGITAYALTRYKGRGVSLLDHLSMLPRVLPHLVIAVAFILAWNASWLPFRIYGTLGILVLAYVAIYQAVGLRFADAGMRQLAPRLEHAAACLGASRLSILIRVVFPILFPSLFVAWISIFVMCLRDWAASIMLLPPGAQTVGSFIFSQFEQGDFAQAMAMSVCTVVLSSIFLVAANFRFYRKAT
ncbi:MAG: iron ABC transporter permease [Terrimicrobiaceae bacterium]|nr:iron ABC transporter permease [Terrimicrobiaceae bacterium]